MSIDLLRAPVSRRSLLQAGAGLLAASSLISVPVMSVRLPKNVLRAGEPFPNGVVQTNRAFVELVMGDRRIWREMTFMDVNMVNGDSLTVTYRYEHGRFP